MQPVVSNGVVWSVSWSVVIMSSATTAGLIETPFGTWTRVGPRNHVLEGGLDPPCAGAILGEKAAHYKV